jgi:hypothetical protein
MRRLIIAFLFLGFPAYLCASIGATPVQQVIAADGTVTGTTLAVTWSSTPTNGNLLTCYFGNSGGVNPPAISSITHTGATWQVAQKSATARDAEIWYAMNVSGASTSMTINLDHAIASVNAQAAACQEWSGVATSSALDAKSPATGTSTTPTSASITPTSSLNELLIASTGRLGQNKSAGCASPFTDLTDASSGGATRTFGCYQVVASTSGAYSTSWTLAGSSTWDVSIASFKAAAGTTASPNRMLLLGVR